MTNQIQKWKAAAEAAVDEYMMHKKINPLVDVARTAVPALCNALEVAEIAMKHEGGMICRDALTRIAKILKEGE